MQSLATSRSVLEIATQRKLDARKCDLRPGHFALLDEARLQAFDADAESIARQHGTKHHVYLLGVQHVHDGAETADLDPGQRLLVALACGGLCSVSPTSMKPAGMVQKPRRGSIARRQTSIRPPCSGTQPAISLGLR